MLMLCNKTQVYCLATVESVSLMQQYSFAVAASLIQSCQAKKLGSFICDILNILYDSEKNTR